MKGSKTIRVLLSILVSVLIFSGIGPVTVFAGKKDIVVGNSSFAEELSATDWSNPDNDISVQNGVIIIPEDSTDETRLITTALVRNTGEVDELFHAKTTFKLTKVPQNEKFIFAFGIQTIESYQGEAGNVEIAFSNQGGLTVEVLAYDTDEEEVVIAKPVRCGSLNSNITIEASLTADAKLTLKVAGKKICDGTKLPVNGQGSFGFLQTGNCAAQISDVDIVVHSYDKPENTNIVENFDNGVINTGVFSSKKLHETTYYPQSISVQEYEGNNVFMFEKCALGYIGTKHQFSNFEMTFDVPYLQRVNEMDAEGNIVNPVSTSFLVSFGGDTVDTSTYGYLAAAETIEFTPYSTVRNLRLEHQGKDEGHLFFDPSHNKAFSVKISVIDAVVTVGLKWMDESQYSTVLTYTLEGGTPSGYIHIWSVITGNFAVDNIRITNMDSNPNLIDVAYQSESFERIPDFEYQEEPLKFKEADDDDKNTGFQWNRIVLYTAIESVVLLGIGFAIGEFLRRKNKKKGEQKDES